MIFGAEVIASNISTFLLKVVYPTAYRGKDIHRAGTLKLSLLLQRRLKFGKITAQERIGGKFQSDIRGDCGLSPVACRLGPLYAFSERRILGLHCVCKRQIGQCVFVGAINPGRRR